MKKPNRKIELDIKVGADSWDLAAHELRAIADRIDRGGPITNLVSGGYDCSHIVSGKENPSQTGETYRAENKKYCDYLRSMEVKQ